MIKRNRESLSPPLPDAKKLHHTPNGMQRPQINGAKKSKQKMKQGGLGQAKSIPITKDEEEVVETLYALARMFPNNKPVKSLVDQKISEAKSPALRERMESPVLASEAPKEASTKSPKASISVEATNLPSSVEGSASDAVKVNCLTESSVLDRPTIVGNLNFVLGLSSISPPEPRISLLSKSEHTDDLPLSVAATSGVSIELCQGTRSAQATQHEALWRVGATVTKQEEQSIKENKDSDTRPASLEGTPALSLGEGNIPNGSGPVWSMVGSHDRELPRSSASKVPGWLDSATTAAKPNSIGSDVSKEKVNPVVVDRKQSLKKCATHVYISSFIVGHQASEKKSWWPVPPDQIKPNGAKYGSTAANSPNGLRNGLDGLISIGDKNGLNGVISIGGSNGSDAGFWDASLKPPQHTGSPFYGPPHLIHADPAKQQQQHHQQQMWAAHHMPGRNTMPHLPNWQNGRHDSPILIHSDGQPLVPSSSLSQEILSSKFPHSIQQQQQPQLFFVSPSSSSSSSSFRGKMSYRHHHHLPSGYDGGGGGGFQADRSSHHLKLVCNAEHS